MAAAIGLCGAHRTGKTTLAREYAKLSGCPYVQTGASKTFARLGLNPAVDYGLALRLQIQQEIMLDLRESYLSVPSGKFITDRTPIDMAAYTIADVTRANLSPELRRDYQAYLDQCIEITNEFFDLLVVVQPGIKIVNEEGKAGDCPVYMEHLNAMCLGFAEYEQVNAIFFKIPRYKLELGERLEALVYAAQQCNEMRRTQAARILQSGVTVH